MDGNEQLFLDRLLADAAHLSSSWSSRSSILDEDAGDVQPAMSAFDDVYTEADVALAEAAAILRELTPAEPAALGLATASTISSSGKAAYQIDSPSTTTTAGMPEGHPTLHSGSFMDSMELPERRPATAGTEASSREVEANAFEAAALAFERRFSRGGLAALLSEAEEAVAELTSAPDLDGVPELAPLPMSEAEEAIAGLARMTTLDVEQASPMPANRPRPASSSSSSGPLELALPSGELLLQQQLQAMSQQQHSQGQPASPSTSSQGSLLGDWVPRSGGMPQAAASLGRARRTSTAPEHSAGSLLRVTPASKGAAAEEPACSSLQGAGGSDPGEDSPQPDVAASPVAAASLAAPEQLATAAAAWQLQGAWASSSLREHALAPGPQEQPAAPCSPGDGIAVPHIGTPHFALPQAEEAPPHAQKAGPVPEGSAAPAAPGVPERPGSLDNDIEDEEGSGGAVDHGTPARAPAPAEGSTACASPATTATEGDASLDEALSLVRGTPPPPGWRHAQTAVLMAAVRAAPLLQATPPPSARGQAPAPTQAPAVAAALPGTPAALAELLPRGLAALRDMGEGLAMSRQLSERSQALAADIASARASLAGAASSGALHAAAAAASNADGQQPGGAGHTAAAAEDAAQSGQQLSSFLIGLKAKYGLADVQPSTKRQEGARASKLSQASQAALDRREESTSHNGDATDASSSVSRASADDRAAGTFAVAAEALQHDEGAGGSCTATERSHDSALDSSSAAQSASGGDVHAAGQQQTSTSLQEAAGPDRLPGDSSADLPRSGSSGACTVDEVRTAAGAGPAQEGGRGLPGLDWQLLRGLLRDNGFPDLPEQVFLQGDRAAAAALSGALEGVLRHVGWKAGLTERLLAAVDTARERQKGMDDALRQLSQQHAEGSRALESRARRAEAATRDVEAAMHAARAAEARARSEAERLAGRLAAREGTLRGSTEEMRKMEEAGRREAAEGEAARRRACQASMAACFGAAWVDVRLILVAVTLHVRQTKCCTLLVLAEERLQRSEAAVAAARQALAQTEHASRAHEAAAQKLRARLAEKVRAEERRQARDADAHRRIKRALALHKGEPRGSNTAGALAAAVRELRPVEIVGLYEGQREGLEMELAVMRSELCALTEQCRTQQNQLAIQASQAQAGRSGNAPARMADIGAAAADAHRAAADARSAAAESARTAAKQLAEAVRRAETLAEQNASLSLELNARPSLKQLMSAQRQVQALEQRLAELQPELGGSSGSSSVEQENHAPGALRGLSTRERMRLDRNAHRMGLDSRDGLSREALQDILQELCAAVGTKDTRELPAQVGKLQRACATLPRLERFVSDVCEAVFRQGAAFIAAEGGAHSPAAVPGILACWVKELEALGVARRALGALRQILLQSGPDESEPSDLDAVGDELLQRARELLAHQRAAAEALPEAAEAVPATTGSPERLRSTNAASLSERIVAHFQQLFDVPTLDGVLPAINQAYVARTEAAHFQNALADMLDLKAGAEPGAILAALVQLVTTCSRLMEDALQHPAAQEPAAASAPGSHMEILGAEAAEAPAAAAALSQPGTARTDSQPKSSLDTAMPAMHVAPESSQEIPLVDDSDRLHKRARSSEEHVQPA